MPGRLRRCPNPSRMRKSQLKFVAAGEDSLLCVFDPPIDTIQDDLPGACVCIPIMSREGFFLLAVPSDFFKNEVLQEAMPGLDEGNALGPSQELTGFLLEEDEAGVEHKIEVPTKFLLLDVNDNALNAMREYDVLSDPQLTIQPFDVDRPQAIVDVKGALPDILSWVENTVGGQRLNFYSAREEQEHAAQPKAPKKAAAQTKKVTTAMLVQQMAAMAEQIQALASRQESMMQSQQPPNGYASPAAGLPLEAGVAARLPPVSAGFGGPPPSGVPKVAQVIGPPPKVRAPIPQRPQVEVPDTGERLEDMSCPPQTGQDTMAAAIMQQSVALTSLVAQLTSGDPITDLTSSGSGGQSLSTKGVARREKMQQDLASGSSNYFLQLQQQLFRKMHPTKPLPKTDQELVSSGVTMTSYMERYGGYKGKPESAMIMWMLSHVADAAAQDNLPLAQEYLALTIAAVEQAALDGSWSIAYVIGLLEEPPAQVFMDRSTPVTAMGRPFAPLIPAAWSAVALAYLKEVELITSKKAESKQGKNAPANKPIEPNQPSPPPKRPKFPKKPKGGGEPAAPKQP